MANIQDPLGLVPTHPFTDKVPSEYIEGAIQSATREGFEPNTAEFNEYVASYVRFWVRRSATTAR